MRYALLGAVLLLSIFAASDALAACYECELDQPTGDAICHFYEEENAGFWADCEGGQTCYHLPGAGTWCSPYCGRNRCYLI